jgi:hypothetical protein
VDRSLKVAIADNCRVSPGCIVEPPLIAIEERVGVGAGVGDVGVVGDDLSLQVAAKASGTKRQISPMTLRIMGVLPDSRCQSGP